MNMAETSSDDETGVVSLERTTQQPHNIDSDLDDAFSDGDDIDTTFEFNSASIREEFARNNSWREPEDTTVAESDGISAQDLDDSISTIDIGGRALESPPFPAPYSRPRIPDGSDSSNDGFSHVSLSDGPALEHDRGPNHGGHDHEPEDGHNDNIPYPTVHIDMPKSPSTHIALAPADTLSDVQTVLSHSDTDHEPQPPHSAPASSSPSSPQNLSPPFPPPSSLHVPTSPTNFTPGHRPTRSVGPTALQKVFSKTRPSFLPPKSKQEDNKHMADWEKMMKQSRVAESKRRKALQERRLAREQKIEDSLHIWERDLVPDWRAVHKNPTLRKLWWGGIPTKLRASMWERAVGNALALSKDNYRACSARAKRALSTGTFPPAILAQMESDILTALPALHIFHPSTGPLYQDLKEMLCAWVVSRSDEGLGYTFGIAKIAAMFLISMPPQQGFVVMRNLLERHCMRSFYGGSAAKEDVEAYYRIFDTLLADGMPKIYFNFKQHHISPAAYLPSWLLPLFLDHLPFEACARLWDILLLEGDSFLFRAALGILAVLEPRLFFPDRQELLELLRGENKAALEVAKRDDRPLDGGKYEIYGVDEETLWERINSMDDWWKESTWTRLIQRELPDL